MATVGIKGLTTACIPRKRWRSSR